MEAYSVAFSVLRLFPIFLERDKASDEWRIEKWAESAARALWRRAVGEQLSATVVNEAISELLPDRRPAGRSAAVKLPKLLKALPRLSVIELDSLRAQIDEELFRRQQTAKAA